MTEKALTTSPSGIPLSALAIPLLLGVYLLITSTQYLLHSLTVYDAKRMLEISLFGIILSIAIIDPKLRIELAAQCRRIPRWIGLGLLGIIGLGVISSAYNAVSPFALAYSLADVYMLAMLVLLTLVVAACRSLAGARFDQLAMLCLALLGLAVGLQEMIGVAVTWAAGYQFSYDIALAHFAHPRFYNQLQSWMIPLLAALPVVFSRHRLAVLLCVLILGLHWYILLMTGARGGTLSVLVALALSLLLFPGARRLILKWQSAGIVLGALIYSLMFLGPDTGFETLTSPTELQSSLNTSRLDAKSPGENGLSGRATGSESNPYLELSLGRPMMNTSGRLRLWRSAAEHAKQNPVLGIGPMNYACKGKSDREGHPHNFVMQLLSEWGLPATLLVLGIMISLLGCLVKRLRPFPKPQSPQLWLLQVVLFTSVIAAVLYSGLSGLMIMPASQVTAVLVCGWLLGTFNPVAAKVIDHRVKHKEFHSRSTSTAVLVFSLTATLILWPFASHETKNMNSYERLLPLMERGTPRFWQSGKVCGLHSLPDPPQNSKPE